METLHLPRPEDIREQAAEFTKQTSVIGELPDRRPQVGEVTFYPTTTYEGPSHLTLSDMRGDNESVAQIEGHTIVVVSDGTNRTVFWFQPGRSARQSLMRSFYITPAANGTFVHEGESHKLHEPWVSDINLRAGMSAKVVRYDEPDKSVRAAADWDRLRHEVTPQMRAELSIAGEAIMAVLDKFGQNARTA